MTRLALAAPLLLAASAARANWTAKPAAPAAETRALCAGGEKDSVAPDEFGTARIWADKGATVVVCSAEKPKGGRWPDEYMVRYSSAPGAASVTLAREAEMMAYGMRVRGAGEALRIVFDWPGEKTSRRVRELRVDCARACAVTEECAIERLRSDVGLPELFQRIRARLDTAQSRADFVDGPDAGDQRDLDQLFLEAAAGNAEALDLLDKTGEGLDAGPAEIVGTYRLYVDDLRARKCRWK